MSLLGENCIVFVRDVSAKSYVPNVVCYYRTCTFCFSAVLPEYLWRMFAWRQMDFDFACSQMVDLILRPASLRATTRMRKQIKNQWSRDDPAFVLILGAMILAGTISYAACYGAWNPLHFARLTIGVLLFEYLLLGALMATAIRAYVNAYMRIQRLHAVEQTVEWAYAFDVHCNALFCAYLLVAPAQYLLIPLLPHGDSSSALLATLLTNTLWLGGVAYYAYITFLGYSALPFVDRAERLLYPLAGVGVLFLLLLLVNVNVGATILDLYFGHDHETLTATSQIDPLTSAQSDLQEGLREQIEQQLAGGR